MQYGFCFISLVPLRREPSEQSEMVSQLLFGDVFFILSTNKDWLLIKLAFDAYEGWISRKQCLIIEEKDFLEVQNWKYSFCEKYIQASYDGILFPICFGSILPKENYFSIAGKEMFLCGRKKIVSAFHIDEMISIYLGAPYLWGGRSPFGIDCSGLVQNIYKYLGVSIERDASEQAKKGMNILSLDKAQALDLLFFENSEKKIVHVGIYLGEQKIIHASSYVKIDTVDKHGIWDIKNQCYSHSLCLIKRYSLIQNERTETCQKKA